jgi:hypothetical protein
MDLYGYMVIYVTFAFAPKGTFSADCWDWSELIYAIEMASAHSNAIGTCFTILQQAVQANYNLIIKHFSVEV